MLLTEAPFQMRDGGDGWRAQPDRTIDVNRGGARSGTLWALVIHTFSQRLSDRCQGPEALVDRSQGGFMDLAPEGTKARPASTAPVTAGPLMSPKHKTGATQATNHPRWRRQRSSNDLRPQRSAKQFRVNCAGSHVSHRFGFRLWNSGELC